MTVTSIGYRAVPQAGQWRAKNWCFQCFLLRWTAARAEMRATTLPGGCWISCAAAALLWRRGLHIDPTPPATAGYLPALALLLNSSPCNIPIFQRAWPAHWPARMTDAGYFRVGFTSVACFVSEMLVFNTYVTKLLLQGTSADQDNRFSDKEKKLLNSMRFEESLAKKVDMKKVRDSPYIIYYLASRKRFHHIPPWVVFLASFQNCSISRSMLIGHSVLLVSNRT